MLKKLTKVLSLLLIFCLVVSMFPAAALADEGSEDPVVTEAPEETTPVITSAPEVTLVPEQTPAPSDPPADSESTGGDDPAGDVSADDESADNDESGNYILSNPDEGVAATSLTMGNKPANGTTSGNPFVKGTGGSNSFRIPALVTLNNGTLVAAADARWNTTYDGGGLDTIVSYSSDKGANWNYTFANYLGDNGNVYNGSGSTAFIDPALATDGSTVYMLCDLYPYGVALNGSGNTAPSTAVGFNSDGKLLLSTNGSNYNYYLDGTVIKDSIGNEVSGLTVDSYFNVTGTYNNTSYNTNLFFSDSPFKVVRTGYLYLTKSTDGGKTWSTPTLIPNVKTSSEQVCLVGPGRGLVTYVNNVKTIVFPVYSYNGSSESQRMGFIYSSNNGASWTRVDSSISWSSEAAVVALKDGTLRFFYRNGTSALCYADYSWTTNSWGDAVNTGIATNSNTQISAISYSKTVDGKQVILVSCPTGPNEAGSSNSGASYRLNGKIFVGYVNSDNTMSWQSDKAISVTSNNNQFMYSCLTELSNGKVAILYENQESAWGTGSNCYYTMDFQTYDLGLTTDTETKEYSITDSATQVTVNFGSNEVTAMTVTSGAEVPALVGSSYVAYNITPNNFTGSAKVTLPVGNLNTQNGIYGFVVEAGGTITKATDGALSDDGQTFTFTAPHFSVVGLAEEGEITDEVSEGGGTATSYVLDTDGLDDGAQYLIVYKASDTAGYAINTSKGSVNVTINGNNATPDGDASAALWTITKSGSNYYIQNGSNYLYPSRSYSNWAWAYNLNITATKTGTSISTSTLAGTYTVASTDSFRTSYMFYDNGWKASNTSLALYFYKYTEGSQTFTVDPSLQEQRIENLTVSNDGYTTDSWAAYKEALDAANSKLNEVKNGSYSSKDAANTALAELTELVDALQTARNNLKKSVSITVNYKAGNVTVKTETLSVDESATSVTLSSTVIGTDGKTYNVDNTTLTLDLENTTTYSVTVTEREGVEISIKENETTAISVTLEDGQTVEWSSADSSYVGVAGKYDTTAGAYTNEAILAGQNVTDSPVVVTGTVYNADGSVAGVYKWLVTVTEGDADTNTTTRYIYINVDTIQNCKVYYSINAGELIPVNGTGVLMNGTTTGHWQITFFAAPDEGYALTYMASTNSSSQYYTLSNGNPDGTGSDAWPFIDPAQTTIPTSNSDATIWKTVNRSLHGFRWALLEGNMTIDQMKVMFSNAIALGCDGILLFTKNGAGTSTDNSSNEKNLHTNLSFVAQKLPTLEKTIKSITHDGTEAAYTDGMKVEIGDTINYSVVVTRYATNATYGTITYNNEKLTDELTNNDGISAPPDMGTSTTSDKTYTYTTSLMLTMDNFADVVKNGKITNTADFSYSYSSQYSSGSLETEASAVAEITVVVPEYVIDFGLPVKIDLGSTILGEATIKSGTASYGTINPNGASFTYKPEKVLQGVDYVTLTLSNGQTYGVNIYPATTVYYEEGFAVSGGSKGSVTQATNVAGASKDEYGYDQKYFDENNGPSNGTQVSVKKGAAASSFSFTGTGVDIYTNNTPESGTLAVMITTKDGSLVKLARVVTAMQNGGSAATTGQEVTAYNVPVFSVDNLAYGNYNVKLTVVDGTVNIDGFRVYNTLNPEPGFYKNDLEDSPLFIELRDQVLAGLSVTSTGSGQVNAAIPTDTTVAVVASSEKYTQENVNDLLENGPKNEIYLQPNQALVLKITTAREVQIGLKALNASTTYTINNGNPVTLKTSTDMFYTVLNKGSTSQQTITITNTGSGILAVTKLKVCDDPNFSFAELTDEDLVPALVSLGYELEPEEPEVQYADAVLTVEVNGKTEVLTKNGVVGESATFTAAEIEAAAQGLVPDGYELKDQAQDVTVAYGASTTVSLRAEEIPTEPEQPEEPEQPTEPEKPEQPSKPANIISAVIRLIDRIFGSLKGLFR